MLTKFYRQSFTLTPTRPYWAKLRTNANALTLERPGLIRQSLYANQVLLGRASIPMPNRLHQAKLHTDANQASLGKASISMPIKH